jgi:cobaltochelatase CobS
MLQKVKLKDRFNASFLSDNAAMPARELTDDHCKVIDSDYGFNERTFKVGLIWMSGKGPNARNLYLTGPTGTGKSSFVHQFAARLGWKVYEYAGSGRTEFSDMVSRTGLQDGNTVNLSGPLKKAMLEGEICLIDELDLINPDESAGLNGVLDGRPLYDISSASWIEPHPNFRLAVTANTGGRGDRSGRYRGAKVQHLGFLNRFLASEVNYMERSMEEKILASKCPGVKAEKLDDIFHIVAEVRRQFINNEINITISTRTLIQWVTNITILEKFTTGVPVIDALDMAVLTLAEPQDAIAVRDLACLKFGLKVGQSNAKSDDMLPF